MLCSNERDLNDHSRGVVACRVHYGEGEKRKVALTDAVRTRQLAINSGWMVAVNPRNWQRRRLKARERERTNGERQKEKLAPCGSTQCISVFVERGLVSHKERAGETSYSSRKCCCVFSSNGSERLLCA